MTEITPVTHIEHPYQLYVTADVMSIDELCLMLRLVKEQIMRLKTCEYQTREALALITTGATKTRRLKGEKFVAKLTYPSDSWTQTVLKNLWADDPEQSQVYLRIATLAPNLLEVKKMQATDGNDRFEGYKKSLLAARVPATSPPTVVIEEA